MARKAQIGVLGASGYTGAELLRLLISHPRVDIALLTADRKAGQEIGAVFPQFAQRALPKLVAINDVDWAGAGLNVPTAVKRGIYTAHPLVIIRRIGKLSQRDAQEIDRSLKHWLGL